MAYHGPSRCGNTVQQALPCLWFFHLSDHCSFEPPGLLCQLLEALRARTIHARYLFEAFLAVPSMSEVPPAEEKHGAAFEAPSASMDAEKGFPVDAEKKSTSSAEHATDHGQATGLQARIMGHSHQADDAMKAFESSSMSDIEMTQEMSRRLLWKIDLNLMPIMCLVYGLNYLDKTTLSYASVMGIQDPKGEGGLALVGDQYNWLSR
jgi:hypothetical protein